MESVEEWRRRKRAEIELIAARVDDPPDPGPLPDPDAVVRAKLALRARVLAATILRLPDLVETNRLEADEMSVHDYRLVWRYQRFDLVLKGPEPYPGLMDGRPSVFRADWTSSGMGAIASVLLALQGLDRPVHLLAHHDAYFETLSTLRNLCPKLAVTVIPRGGSLHEAARAARSGDRLVVWWGDSYSQRDPRPDLQALDGALFDHVLFDSTCYEASSPRLRAVLDAAADNGLPLVLVRSHLKLDFLGVEWGRLGSMLHYVTPFLSAERIARYRRLAASSARTLRRIGATAVPLHLNPFAADPGFHTLNRDRVARIVAANRRVAGALTETLAGAPVPVRTFHHGLFVTLGFFGTTVGPPSVRAASDDLVATLRAAGLSARLANSFAFDFVAVAPFRDSATGRDELRLAVPDWPEAWLDALATQVARWARTTSRTG